MKKICVNCKAYNMLTSQCRANQGLKSQTDTCKKFVAFDDVNAVVPGSCDDHSCDNCTCDDCDCGGDCKDKKSKGGCGDSGSGCGGGSCTAKTTHSKVHLSDGTEITILGYESFPNECNCKKCKSFEVEELLQEYLCEDPMRALANLPEECIEDLRKAIKARSVQITDKALKRGDD